MLIYLIQTYVGTTRHNAAAALQYKDLIKNGPIGTPSSGIPVVVALPAPPPTVAAGALPRLRLLVQEIKNKPSYNVGIGSNLGIATTAATTNMDPPAITLVDDHAGNLILNWIKGGWSGVKVQSRAQGTADWTDLGLDLFSPFVDTRPLRVPNTPEVREYRMCHLDGDTPLLNWSSVTVVTVKA
jgi:hypothetical protein